MENLMEQSTDWESGVSTFINALGERRYIELLHLALPAYGSRTFETLLSQ